MAEAAAEMAGVEKVLEQMEEEQALLGTCASLWRTLAAHLAAVDESLRLKSQTLAAAADSLDTRSHQSLASLLARESALPARESAAAARVATLRDAALADLRSALDGGGAPPGEAADLIRLHCRRMDARPLWRLVAARRRDAEVEAEVAAAVADEAVDPARLVLDAVEDFVAGVGTSDDQRWAVGVILRAAFFPAADSEAVGAAEPGWSVAERAAAVAEKWRERMGEKESKLVPLEGIMFLQFVNGFRLGSRLDEQLLKDLVIRFAAEKDAAKLALALFKDKLPGKLLHFFVCSSVFTACTSFPVSGF